MGNRNKEFICPKTGKVIKKKKLPVLPLWLTNVIGFFALIWFLIRVIPKPKRITYPCQQVAAPLAMSYLSGILGLFGIAVLLRNVKVFIRKWNYAILAVAVSVAFITTSCVLTNNNDKTSDASSSASITEDYNISGSTESADLGQDKDNGIINAGGQYHEEAMGQGIGINPGRVVWIHNPEATSWDGKTGYWWEDSNTDPVLVEQMVSQSLQKLTGKNNDKESWDALFKHFNQTHTGEDNGYKVGEKVAIKVNMNGVTNIDKKSNQCFTSPQVIYSTLKQLVDKAGVAPKDITVFDASREIPDSVFDKCNVEELKGVTFAGFAGGNGREKCQRDTSFTIKWSEDVKGNPTYLPVYVTEAKYLINISSIKGHDLAGITLNAKNHFGTIMSDIKGKPTKNPPQGANLHGYITAHDYGWGNPEWTWPQRPMNTYTPLVDLMAHEHLGGKTLLYMQDGLYSSNTQNGDVSVDSKWKSEPFNNDWTSSIFVSQDGLAIDSLGYDLLSNEPVISGKGGVIKKNSTCENYLHEAGQVSNPPSNTFYDPEGDGIKVENLGVHEHWNSADEKQYSRNLGKNYGIELIR